MITLDKRIKDLRGVIDRAKKSSRPPEYSQVSGLSSGLLDSSMSSQDEIEHEHNPPNYTEISFNPEAPMPLVQDRVQQLRKVLSKTRKNSVRQQNPSSMVTGVQLSFTPQLKELVINYQRANRRLWRLTKPEYCE